MAAASFSLRTQGHELPVALDAMGGDGAPEETVKGAVTAARNHGLHITLVGQMERLQPIISSLGGPFDRIAVLEAPDVVAMEEHAVAAVRRKTRASITVALEEVRDGRARAVVSAGNSGAVVAAAIFILGRNDGVERPGIAIPFPTLTGSPVYLIDAGAVVDPRPNHLVRYAYLIRDFLQRTRQLSNPRIGLLSNGEEPGKGSNLVREVHDLLSGYDDINFVGNIEANELARGHVDAVVCDGFSGNVLLKSAEGTAALMQDAIRRALTSRWYRKLLAGALRPAFREAAQQLDYREYGGAPLLGVGGAVFIAHGRSDARAIESALIAAHRATSGVA